MKNLKKRKYRLQGINLFLTYPTVSMEREEVLKQLRKKLEPRKIAEYVVSTEKHETGEEHIHVYLRLDKRCDIRDCRRLDLENGEEKIHGKYESCRSPKNVVKYVVKGGLEGLKTNMELKKIGMESEGWEAVLKLAESGHMEESLEMLRRTDPKTVVKSLPNVMRSLRMVQELKNRRVVESYNVADYEWPEEILDWYHNERNEKVLFLRGKTGTGKTEGMKAFLEEKFGKAHVLRVNSLEGLKDLRNHHMCVLLDDCSVKGKSAEEIIGLLDVKNESTVRILYGTVKMGASLCRIIITNLEMDEYFDVMKKDEEQVKAFRRRLKEVALTESLLGDKKNDKSIDKK